MGGSRLLQVHERPSANRGQGWTADHHLRDWRHRNSRLGKGKSHRGAQDCGRPPVHPDCEPHAAALLPPGRPPRLQRRLPQKPGQVSYRGVTRKLYNQESKTFTRNLWAHLFVHGFLHIYTHTRSYSTTRIHLHLIVHFLILLSTYCTSLVKRSKIIFTRWKTRFF